MINRAHIGLTAALIVCGVLSTVSQRIFDPYILDVVIGVGINVILAVSLNLINGYTGQFSLGHGGFMAVGAYTSAAITLYLAPKLFGGSPAAAGTAQAGLIFVLALIGGGLVSALGGVIVGAPSLRLKGDYLAIVTLGFGEIIRVIFQNTTSLGGALGLNGIPPYTNFFWVFCFVIISVYAVVCMVHSTYGRGFLAVHDDEVAAEAMGLNTTRYKIIAFVVGAFFAGIAGGLWGHFKLTIEPTGFNFMKSIEIVVMVILGGMGNTVGVIIAAVVLTLLPEWLRRFSDYRMIVYSALLIVLMLACPGGLAQIWTSLINRWRRKIST